MPTPSKRSRLLLRCAPALVVGLATSVLAVSPRPAAAVDGGATRQVQPGGSLSTGSTVSREHPVQLTLTTSAGGTLTVSSVELVSGAPRNALGAADDTVYYATRFVIPAGGAKVSSATALINGALVPDSTQYHGPGFRAGPEVVVQFSVPDVPLTGADLLAGRGPGPAQATRLPDGNVLVELGALPSSSPSGLAIDLGRPRFKGYGAFSRNGSIFPDSIRATATGLSTKGSCSLYCTDSTTVTLATADARRLGLTNPVIAAGALQGMTYAHGGTLPLTGAAKAALKKAVAAARARKPICTTKREKNGWIGTSCKPPAAVPPLVATARTTLTGTVPGDQMVLTGPLKILIT